MSKDYNYIAAVEKAISEKYGKDTAQDFRSTWAPDKEKKYLEQLGHRRKKRIKKHMLVSSYNIAFNDF